MQSTVQQIAPIIARETGLDWDTDRPEIFDEINECRELMFSALGKSVRDALFRGNRCFPIQKFSQDCRKKCATEYYGISVPAEIPRADVMRLEGVPVKLLARHAGPVESLHCRPYQCPLAIDMGSGWSLPSDPPECMNLGFRLATGREVEEDLRVAVTYYDLNGRLQREDIPLSNETTYTQFTVATLAMSGITLPPGRREMVEVWDDNGKLAEFHPSIDVPNFHRYALSTPVCGSEVVLEDALQTPARALYTTDPVETGDSNFWRNVIQWKKLHFTTKRTPAEERAYASTSAILREQAMALLEIRESDNEMVVIEPDIHHNKVSRAFRNFDRRRSIRTGLN